MPGPVARLRGWMRRMRATLARLERLEQGDADLAGRIDALRPLFLEDLRSATHQIHSSVASVERRLGAAGDAVDGAAAEQGVVTRAALAADRADDVSAAIVSSLGPASPVRPGLTIFTITWNHAHLVTDALASGLAVLDALGDDAGEALVFDNGSSDETARVLDEICARDQRVRVVTAPENIGLARARNVLLHACDREHALMLDADNVADVDGARSVYEVARRHRALLTYGVLSWRDQAGGYRRLGSAGPVTPVNLERLDIDTFMVVDVAGMRAIEGWTIDPVLQAFDDQELVRRAAYRGELIGCVPVLLGTYRVTPDGHSRARGDVRPRVERIARMYPIDDASPIAAFMAHPDTGPLWASDAAIRRVPELRPPARPTSGPEASRILVVAPGGVGNLGDDLITTGLVERITRQCPRHDVELITDGPWVAAELGACAWSGTINETVDALDRCADARAAWSPVDLARFDAVVVGGGGNLNSIWQDDLVVRRARLFDHVLRAGVPIIVSGQGVGPFTDERDARAVGALLERARAVGVRDAASRAEVEALGVACQVVGDDALGLDAAPDEAVRTALAAIGADPDVGVVSLHVRHAPYVNLDHGDFDAWAGALDTIAVERGAQVIGVALNWEAPVPEPIALLQLARDRKAAWRILDDPAHPRVAAGVLRRADRALVASYHAALVSIEARVPTLYSAGSDYTLRKAEGLRELAQLPPELVVTPGTPPDELADRFAAVERALDEGAGLQAASAAVDEWSDGQLRALIGRARPSSGRPGD